MTTWSFLHRCMAARRTLLWSFLHRRMAVRTMFTRCMSIREEEP